MILRSQYLSIGIELVAVKEDAQGVPTVANLLLEEKSLTSPGSIAIITKDGTHLFFRNGNTIEQTEKETALLVEQTHGVSLKDFAKWNQINHFYCPFGETIATPVFM